MLYASPTGHADICGFMVYPLRKEGEAVVGREGGAK